MNLSQIDNDGKIIIKMWAQAIYNETEIPFLISTLGEVKYSNEYSKPKKRGRPYNFIILRNREYVRFSIDKKIISAPVSRIMLETFTSIPEKYINKGLTLKDLEADHIDGDKLDNRISNLQWLTPKENQDKATKNKEHLRGDECGPSIYTSDQIKSVCIELERNKLKIKDISKLTGVNRFTIHQIMKKKAWIEISENYQIDNYIVTRSDSILNPPEIHKICQLLVKGESPANIAHTMNINPALVYKTKYGLIYRSVSKNYF